MNFERLGPYRIGRQLGKGGMGSVFEAVDEKSSQRVAVKALSPQLAMADGFRERFESEIESLKKLQHEGIVRLYGYGEEGGVLFYSMERVDGPSLEQEINRGRRFDWRDTLAIAIQTCRALKHAHDCGVVHRDIKPANLLLTPEGKVKIADFGIARLFGANQLTTAGGVLGTADYMSPEQADGRPVTDRCDQYALGCVIFTLLAGRPPFRAKTMPEMLQLQRFAEPEPVRRYAPDTPPQLERLVNQLLSKDPADRFPNVLVLSRHMEAMEKALSREPKPEPVERISTLLPSFHAEATAAYDAEATRGSDEPLLPLELSESSLYEGPTMADPELELAPSAAAATSGISLAAPTAPAPMATQPKTKPPTTAPPRTRFTTVDEDAARREREAGVPWWAVAVQLVSLAAALGGLGWLGWRLTRPPTADALYEKIIAANEVDGIEGVNRVSADVDDFLERFHEDPRATQIKKFDEELELIQMEKQLVARHRFADQPLDAPIAAIYQQASALSATDPARAAQQLADLLILYRGADQGMAALGEEERRYLALADRLLERTRAAAKSQSAALLKAFQERLAAANKIEPTNPQQAAAMYRALISLAGDRPFAAEVVAASQKQLDALSGKNPAPSQ